MITLVVDAARIPDETTVRRPTGQKEYTLKREIKIHADSSLISVPQGIKCNGDVVFLMSEGNINAVAGTTKLAIDFEDEEQSVDFLEELIRPPNLHSHAKDHHH